MMATVPILLEIEDHKKLKVDNRNL